MSKQITIPKFDAFGKPTKEQATYYVDGFPADLKKQLGGRWNSDWELAKRNVNFYNHKYTNGESDTVSQLRSLYKDITQPSEGLVKRAMLLIINEDYALKAGGESASDAIYSSSLRICIADPKTFEDKDVVLIKKYSTKFSDVLITMPEIEALFEGSLSPKEKTGVLQDEAFSIVREFKVRELGGKSNFHDGKRLMSLEFAEKMLALYKKRGVSLEMYNKAIDSKTAYLERELNYEIIEDVAGKNKTKEHYDRTLRHIEALKKVRAFITERYQTELV